MKDINQAILKLKAGGVIIFPTETLYGLGASALDEKAVQRIYQIKKRSENKPFPVIIGEPSQLDMLLEDTSNAILEFIKKKFWPGPLSVVLPGRKNLPRQILSNRGLICVRYTSHPIARKLCLLSGFPLVATSANISGASPPKNFNDISCELIQKVDYVLKLGPSPKGAAPSTIIRFLNENTVEIIREGAISSTHLKSAGLNIVIKQRRPF